MERLVVEGVDLTKFLDIPYVGRRHPENVSVAEFLSNPELGSNCQLFALGVLAYAGFQIEESSPEGGRMGSRELWLRNSFTHYVVSEDIRYLAKELKPFDILFFFPKDASPWELERLHIGIYIGEVDGFDSPNCVLHNHDMGGPGSVEVWYLEQFEACEKRYWFRGAKRPIYRNKD